MQGAGDAVDQDREWQIDIPALDPSIDDGGGDDGDEPPNSTGGGRGGSGPHIPPGDPFLHSRWAAVIPAIVMLAFGALTITVLLVSRSGLGSETVAWAMSTIFIVMFTALFIGGSRFIGRYRY